MMNTSPNAIATFQIESSELEKMKKRGKAIYERIELVWSIVVLMETIFLIVITEEFMKLLFDEYPNNLGHMVGASIGILLAIVFSKPVFTWAKSRYEFDFQVPNISFYTDYVQVNLPKSHILFKNKRIIRQIFAKPPLIFPLQAIRNIHILLANSNGENDQSTITFIFTHQNANYAFKIILGQSEMLLIFKSILQMLYDQKINITERNEAGDALYLLENQPKEGDDKEIDAYYAKLIDEIGRKEEN
ncbi:MAG: hypothetical protein ACKVTZ_21785 [Bacteroidia bacterium]